MVPLISTREFPQFFYIIVTYPPENFHRNYFYLSIHISQRISTTCGIRILIPFISTKEFPQNWEFVFCHTYPPENVHKIGNMYLNFIHIHQNILPKSGISIKRFVKGISMQKFIFVQKKWFDIKIKKFCCLEEMIWYQDGSALDIECGSDIPATMSFNRSVPL